MIPAVILAAGASSRMGRAKALLPAGPGGPPFVVALAGALLDGGADDLVVVVSGDPDPVAMALRAHGRAARLLINEDPSRGQLSSLLIALNLIDAPGVRAALVAPVDLPLVSAGTVRAVIAAYRRTPAPIVRPARRGIHGHPVLFDRALFDELRHADLRQGAREVVHAHAQEGIEVPIEDEGAFTDIDTPDDYERLFGMPPPDGQ